MKVINKYPILTEVLKIDENSILLKFEDDFHYGRNEDVFMLTIIGKNIAESIGLINEHHLNYPTVIADEVLELIFYSGHLKESPDWGDWTSAFSLPFEKYEAEFNDKLES